MYQCGGLFFETPCSAYVITRTALLFTTKSVLPRVHVKYFNRKTALLTRFNHKKAPGGNTVAIYHWYAIYCYKQNTERQLIFLTILFQSSSPLLIGRLLQMPHQCQGLELEEALIGKRTRPDILYMYIL